MKHEKVSGNIEVQGNLQTFGKIDQKLDRRKRSIKTFGVLIIVVVSALLLPSGLSAKPNLDEFGKCVFPSKCISQVDTTCAKLYCKALAAKCNGDYSSGECHDILEMNDSWNCALFAKSGCGGCLPEVLPQHLKYKTPQEISPLPTDEGELQVQ